ncbi:MAG: methyltransferase [Christensenellaceae bacterium]|jgi:tRNA1Val (adenine37-N6)-methyltransferase|nr:methyltransferase [Christensenellaceae bacterium]
MLFENEVIDDLQCDGLKIIRNTKGYAFTSDSVLLANFAKARMTDCVLDLGTGSGIIPILMSKKTKANHFVGIDIQADICDLARRSIELNNLSDRITIINNDMTKLTEKDIGKFDVVVSNPPYYTVNQKNKNINERAISRSEIMINLKELIATAHRLINYGGLLYMVLKADRLVDCLTNLREKKIEPKLLIPVQPTPNKPVDVLLIKAKYGGRAGLIIEKPIIAQGYFSS